MTMSFQLLVLLTAWGSAITGGIFYAFSSFVMAALAHSGQCGHNGYAVDQYHRH